MQINLETNIQYIEDNSNSEQYWSVDDWLDKVPGLNLLPLLAPLLFDRVDNSEHTHPLFLFRGFSIILCVLETTTKTPIDMAGKVTRLSKIKQLSQRHRDGASNRSIARELCIYKGTVNDYVNKVAQNNLDVNELLKLDDSGLEALFLLFLTF